MRKLATVVILCAFLVASAAAQSSLQNAFLGREVELKLDMPATQQGVDLNFSSGQPLDWRTYSQRLKQFGVAIRKGDTPTVTSLVVKKDRIEFQLDGGGYGTFWDDTSGVSARMIGKSNYERQLENDLSRETDPRRRDQLRRELDRERSRREREQFAENSRAAVANQIKQQEIAGKRLQGGSRFNLRWTGRIPESDLTPEAIMQRLEPWVSFSGTRNSPNVFAPNTPPPAPNSNSAVQLQRGMKMAAVEAMLGRGQLLTENTSGDGLRSSEYRYVTTDNLVDVTYVEGVLVRYSISSR
ncbi:MAG: hypothetical protein HYX28_06270 [Candidatus Koribacter versatilis]|uniref:Uncharacterized protein n=1 Tax=Candidatus Korobacter versatilis TaxID=658062 RepID=A0A932A7X5_9BACT|nr:hypothetical protein [Candidatus Koribacter versatilis]